MGKPNFEVPERCRATHHVRLRGVSVAADPNNRQSGDCWRHAGAARYGYNWAVAIYRDLNSQYWDRRNAGEDDPKVSYPSGIELHKRWNAWKKETDPDTGAPNCAWWGEVSKCAFQEAFNDAHAALGKYFKSREPGYEGPKVGFPRFHKKATAVPSFRLTGTIKLVDNRHCQLPRLGVLKVCENMRVLRRRIARGLAKILSVTVTWRRGRWQVSFCVAEAIPNVAACPQVEATGVDLGLVTHAVAATETSDVAEHPAPKALRANLRRLRRASRKHSRCVKGSRNRDKARRRLDRVHHHVANIREDNAHKVSHQLVAETQGGVLCPETLKPKNMLQNPKLARAIADAGLATTRRFVGYKAKDAGIRVIDADMWFPSSKRHHGCGGYKHDLKLSDRTWVCPKCGQTVERDPNAARNLAWYGNQVLAGNDPMERVKAERELQASGESATQADASLPVSPPVQTETINASRADVSPEVSGSRRRRKNRARRRTASQRRRSDSGDAKASNSGPGQKSTI